jgi:hypothetical protein
VQSFLSISTRAIGEYEDLAGAPVHDWVQGKTFLIEYDNTQNGANHNSLRVAGL